MAVKRFSNSLISQSGQDKVTNFIAGYSPAIDEMDLIERVTLSASAASITFSNIPQTYQNLQLRIVGRTSRTGANGDYMLIRFNNITSASYAYHLLYGNGSTTTAAGYANQTYIGVDRLGDSSNTDYYGAIIVDIIDYKDTTKNTTIRSIGGNDRNGAGEVDLDSGVFLSTNAVTSISLSVDSNRTFTQNTTSSLYGVKA